MRIAVPKSIVLAGWAKCSSSNWTLPSRLIPWFHRDVEWQLLRRVEAAIAQPNTYGSFALLCAHGAPLRGLLLVETGSLRLGPPERSSDPSISLESGGLCATDDVFDGTAGGLVAGQDRAVVSVGIDDIAGEMAVLFPLEQVLQVHCWPWCTCARLSAYSTTLNLLPGNGEAYLGLRGSTIGTFAAQRAASLCAKNMSTE